MTDARKMAILNELAAQIPQQVRDDEVTVKELAQHLGISISTAKRFLDEAVEAGRAVVRPAIVNGRAGFAYRLAGDGRG